MEQIVILGSTIPQYKELHAVNKTANSTWYRQAKY